MKNKVVKIENGSLAEEVEIEVGDRLISINENKIEDVIDYMFLMADENVLIEVEKKNGEIWEVEIEKDFDEDLGVEFENPILDSAKSCKNGCVFCFIDQLPKGMRESLYFKDDDSRLSFLQGNFVTLTNLSDKDIERIISYQISPINVSVHTTNSKLRCEMLNNRFAGNIMERLEQLTSNNILVNAQIVLCPGYNDKEQLDKTIKDLSKLNKNLNSVAVVPIGLTKFRDGLEKIEAFDKDASYNLIKQVESMQEEYLKSRDTRFVFIGDEFYVNSKYKIPKSESYEGYENLEDGIGLLRYLMDSVEEYLSSLTDLKIGSPRKVTILTGCAAYEYILEMVDGIETKFPEISVNVVAIKNNFFGEKITITGLLTGKDIIEQSKYVDLGDEVLLSEAMFRTNDTVLLDDYDIIDIEDELKTKVSKVKVDGKDFVDRILGL